MSEVKHTPGPWSRARPTVTEFNVGRWCLSEDECIADHIDFRSYELGVIDAARAFGNDRAVLAGQAKSAAPNPFLKALDIRIEQGWQLGGNACPVLYTDTINGEQVCRDDLWLATTAGLKSAAPVEPDRDLDEWARNQEFANVDEMNGAFMAVNKLRSILATLGAAIPEAPDTFTMTVADALRIVDANSDRQSIERAFRANVALASPVHVSEAPAQTEASDVVSWLRANTNEFGAAERIEARFAITPVQQDTNPSEALGATHCDKWPKCGCGLNCAATKETP